MSSPLFVIADTAGTSMTMRVEVSGDLDAFSADQFRGSVLGLMERHPVLRLEMDLSALTFLDCAGISALVAVNRSARAGGGHTVIVAADPASERLLAATGVGGALGYLRAGSPDPAPARRQRRARRRQSWRCVSRSTGRL